MKGFTKYIYILIVLITVGCSEQILQTCLEEPDIEFKFKASTKELSGDSSLLKVAEDANFTVLHKNYQTGNYNELAKLQSDLLGEAAFPVPNSGCGISSVKVKVGYDLYFLEEEYDFLCCDTSFAFVFENDSLPENVISLDCNSLDTMLNKKLTNELGGCVAIGSSEAVFDNSRFIYIRATDSMRINVNSLFELELPFYANVSSDADANGWITIGGAAEQSFTIGFLANTEIDGVFNTSLVLPVECLDGSENTGNISINLATEICSGGCNCPFASDNSIFEIQHITGDILPGETVNYNNNSLFQIDNNLLTASCLMEVEDIRRYPSGKTANEITAEDEAVYDWILETELLIGEQFTIGDEFMVDLVFSPTNQGILIDTFEVVVNIVDNTGNILDDQCSFLIEVTGKTCVAPVPEIVINNFYDARVVNSGVVTDTLQFGSVQSFSESDFISQELDSKLENLCPTIEFNQDKVSYQIKFPDGGEDYCSNMILVLNENVIGANNDAVFFESNYDLNSNVTLSQNSSLQFNVTFNAPDVVSHLRSGHPDEYKIEYEIVALTATKDTIAVQKIDLASSVFSTLAEVSEPQLMRSFSQVSDLQSNPSYQAFKIDELNVYYDYYGKVDNLNPQQGNIDFASDPVLPSTYHSFIFDVDEPTNKTKLQTPKLYLVKNDLNKFRKITSFPVAQYASSDAFSDDLDNLIEKIYTNSTFTSDATPSTTFQFTSNANTFNWSPSVEAEQMTLGNGVELALGGVYIIWNPYADKNEDMDIDGDTYNNYCDVALLYIDGISDGSGTTTHTGYVGFYVAFPLGLVKNK